MDLDNKISYLSQKLSAPLARFSLFVIYFWFGFLKLIGSSPANPLVQALEQKTLPFIPYDTFIVLFALFEMLIGILFLVPKATRINTVLFVLHMGMTLMPMVFLPQIAWQSFMVPTLEGQYMIKNLALVSLVAFLLSKQETSKY